MEENLFLYDCKNEQLQEEIALEQNEFIKECEPPEWLKKAEYPFKWLTMLKKRMIPQTNIITETFNENHHKGLSFNFQRMTKLLSLATMKSLGWYQHPSDGSDVHDDDDDDNILMPGNISKDYDSATLFTLCQETVDQMAKESNNAVWMRLGEAINHVVLATKSHMLYLDGFESESREIGNNIIQVEKMSLENQGGIEGIKMSFISEVSKEYEAALQAGLRAIELDPQWAHWPFLIGIKKNESRHKDGYDIPSDEFEHLEKAVELERSAEHMVILARSYLERSQNRSRSTNESVLISREEINSLQQKAVDLYRESLILEKDSYTIIHKVGIGLMKIKEEFTDLTVAKEALIKCRELRPCGKTAHALGRFYYRHEKDDEKALECFSEFRGYFCTSEIIRIKLLQDSDYDPFDIIQEWIEKDDLVIKTARKNTVTCDIGWYYLVFKKDLNMAVTYFWKVLKEDYKSFYVTQFKSYPFFIGRSLNIIPILLNEIMLIKERNKSLPPAEREKNVLLDNFLENVLEKDSDLKHLKPDPNLLRNTVQQAEKFKKCLRRKRYGSSSYRGMMPRQNINHEATVSRGVARERSNELDVKRHEYGRKDSRSNRDGPSSGHGSDQARWRSSTYQENTKTNWQRHRNRNDDTTVSNWRTECKVNSHEMSKKSE